MPAYDVKREFRQLYAPGNRDWELVEVPEQQFLAINGTGNPNTAVVYADAVAALYAVAYTLKFASKKNDRDFVVSPLEGLWWADDPGAFTIGAKDSWHWTMLLALPSWIDGFAIDAARRAALLKKKSPAIDTVEHRTLQEGRCAQTLHLGPYDEEAAALAALHGPYFARHQLEFAGPHHEIYLSDPRRVAPAKLKTVLRQPVRAVGSSRQVI